MLPPTLAGRVSYQETHSSGANSPKIRLTHTRKVQAYLEDSMKITCGYPRGQQTFCSHVSTVKLKEGKAPVRPITAVCLAHTCVVFSLSALIAPRGQ